jgi:phosphatidylethanolamine-binding protein (PEBP) family uncharacterized protein
MISFYAIVPLACALLAAAQSSNPAFELEVIKANFEQAGIIHDLFTTFAFNPDAVLTMDFKAVTNGSITPGQPLTETQVATAPELSVTPANSSVTFSGNYTIAMVDAGPVGTNDAGLGVTRHWLVNDVKISGTTVNTNGTVITVYAGPAPPAKTGPHRYTVLLFVQPPNFVAPAGFNKPNIGVSVFNLGDYIKNSSLGPVVAGNYFTVEEDTATASLSPTSAVITSTLPPVPSGTTTATNTSSQSKPTGAALGLKDSTLSLFTLLSSILATLTLAFV